MKSYLFRVVVEPDEERWHAYCPALDKYGAATWGYTKGEEEVFLWEHSLSLPTM